MGPDLEDSLYFIATQVTIGMAECPTCDKVCDTESGMKNHHARVHGESLAKKEYCCPQCGDSFVEYESQAKWHGDNYCSRECYDEKQSKDKTGKSLEEIVGEEGAKKSRRKSSERMLSLDYSGENNPMYGRERNPSDETKEKISNSLKGREASTTKWMYDEELGHFTRSNWERVLGRELVSKGIEYEYEGLEVEMGEGSVYRPDFIIRDLDLIVEVKGRVWKDDAYEKARKCMDQYPDFNYVVLGTELPSDIHFDWDSRDEFLSKLEGGSPVGCGDVTWEQI